MTSSCFNAGSREQECLEFSLFFREKESSQLIEGHGGYATPGWAKFRVLYLAGRRCSPSEISYRSASSE